jgi:hypothetical protein
VLLTPRYTVKRFNPNQPRHPAGTIIGGIAVGGRWARVLGRALRSRRWPGGSAASAPAAPDPLALVRSRARERAQELLEQVRDYHRRRQAGESQIELERIRVRIGDTTGVKLRLLDEVGLDDGEVTPQVLARLMASGGDWDYWIPAREIRRAAFELAGFDTEGREADVHVSHDEAPGARVGFSVTRNLNVPELRRMQAYVLMSGVRDAPRVPELYRGVDLMGMGLPAVFKEGAFIDLPLASFGTRADVVARYGTDVTFVVRDAKAVRGGQLDAPDDLPAGEYTQFMERYDPREYVTGGRFRIVRVEKTSAEDGDRYLIELEQVGVYDPDTGQLVETKAADDRRKPKVPDYDWMFDGSLAAAQRSRRRGR